MRVVLATDDPEQVAFELFADTYPHEAAVLDFGKFTAYARTVNPQLTDEVIRKLLAETE